LFDYLAERDLEAAERARVAIEKAFGFLQTFPFACRNSNSRLKRSRRRAADSSVAQQGEADNEIFNLELE